MKPMFWHADRSDGLARQARWGLLAAGLWVAMAGLPALAQSGEAGGGAHPAAAALGTIAALLGILVFKAACVGAALFCAAACPSVTERAQGLAAARPVRYLLLGIVDAVAALLVFTLLVAMAKRAPALSLVAVLFLLAVCALAVLGLAGVYGALGRRLLSDGVGREPGREILSGGAILETGALLPVVGWAGYAVALLVALGVGVAAPFGGKAQAQPAAAPEATEDEPESSDAQG